MSTRPWWYLRVYACGLVAVAATAACSSDNGGSSPPPLDLGEINGISAGDRSTCITNNLGKGFCWGANDFGQLGDGTHEAHTSAVEVSGGLTFSSISAGDHACGTTALDNLGWCWGKGTSGELGNGASTSSTIPVPVAGGHLFDQIFIGASSCGFRYGGEAYCWGPNASGQLGTGDFAPHDTPVLVTGGLTFVRYGMGARTACGLAAFDGFTNPAYCWGSGEEGELGNGSFGVVSAIPIPLSTTMSFGAFSIGGRPDGGGTVCAEGSGGTYCWGSNSHGQLADGTMNPRNVPAVTPGTGPLILGSVVVGPQHACGRGSGAKAYCWGKGGLLGDGTTASSTTPVLVAGGLVWSVLTVGGAHTCGRTDDTDELYCWGENESGQLGDGTRINRLVPVKVLGQ